MGRSALWIGSIPAPAGKPTHSRPHSWPGRVYPRACGETPDSPDADTAVTGLSPRLRGNPVHRASCRGGHGSIPAPAGKPPLWKPDRVVRWVYPRACGETGGEGIRKQCKEGLSPRLRGNHASWREQLSEQRSIPAPAGKPRRRQAQDNRVQVYPRACGETPW